GLEQVVGIGEDELGAAATEEAAEHLVEGCPDTVKGVEELLPRHPIDLADRLVELFLRLLQVGSLVAQESKALGDLREFLDRFGIHGSERLDLPLEPRDLAGGI